MADAAYGLWPLAVLNTPLIIPLLGSRLGNQFSRCSKTPTPAAVPWAGFRP
ncbi:hypothetical protein [Streptomyces purpurogeneiscleroticus]|uniref:hypothetical protein n=1 Tax=Streptomyces purpurogeneiscleroticus TaxID=68259 RepID=UPI001CBC999D|nr:hypothetical protein [Streptomyces purpurogeneiscleroticus]